MTIYTSFEWEEITYVKRFFLLNSSSVKCVDSMLFLCCHNGRNRLIIEKKTTITYLTNLFLRTSYSSFHSLSLPSSIIYRQWKYLYLFPLCFWVEPMKRASPSFCHQCVYIKKRSAEKEWVCLLNILLFLLLLSLWFLFYLFSLSIFTIWQYVRDE